MPLAYFPAAFNLTELKKGFFPHEFNLPQHQSYVAQIPALEFFDPDSMNEKKKKELQEWHAEQVRGGTPYDFAKEMEDYCKSDVALLQAGCELSPKNLNDTPTSTPLPNVSPLLVRATCTGENTASKKTPLPWNLSKDGAGPMSINPSKLCSGYIIIIAYGAQINIRI